MLGSFTRLTTLAIPIPRSLSPCFAHRSRNQNRKTGHIERRKSHLASALRNEPNYSPRANESKKGGENSLPPLSSLLFHYHRVSLSHLFPRNAGNKYNNFYKEKKKERPNHCSLYHSLYCSQKGKESQCYVSRMKTVTGRKVSARLGLLDIDEEEMDRSRIDNGREDALVEQEAPHRHLHARSRFLNHCL